MTWSINFIGTPANIAAALERHSKNLTGASSVEYDAVKPHIVGILNQNYGTTPAMMKVIAKGHGYEAQAPGGVSNRACQVTVEFIYEEIV